MLRKGRAGRLGQSFLCPQTSDADDVYTDPRTREFAKDYFPACGITSMLDAPIHFGGALHGVLCCEHTGLRRQWSSNEKTFALALANLVSLALEEWERAQVEEQLRLHSAALEAASNGIIITECDGTIIWANPSFSRNSGYTREEAIGRKPGELLNSRIHEAAFFEELWRTILSGKVWRGTIINRRKSGDLYSEAQTISPIFDGEGAITHYRLHEEGIKALVTEKKQHSGNSEERHVRQAQWLIREQYRDYNSLQDVADELGINPAYLARCCKRVLQCSIGDLILEQRIRAAQDFLKNSDMPLKEISNRCGFGSLNYFCRRFKQAIGKSPGSWRQHFYT